MIDIRRTTLSNGLQVVSDYDSSTAMAAVNVLYNVGARDECSDMTGLAHLLEHLMFGGSVNVADFDGELQRAGGISNAWTSNDYTNFYDVLPAHNIETAFRLESDRMLSLDFNEKTLETQRSVVTEEFKQQCLNQPYGDLGHHLRSLVFTTHPYRWPVIGKEPGHIAKITLDDVRRFFTDHYAPGNAVLCVSGNVPPERVFSLAEKWFSGIPARPTAPRTYRQEPVQTAARRLEVSGNVPMTSVSLAFPMQGYGTRQYFVADIITDILSNGESSRFFRRLLPSNRVFAQADASILGSDEPGMLMLSARLTDNSPEAADSAASKLLDEASRLATEPVTQREITRAVNRLNSSLTFGNLNYLARAQAISLSTLRCEDFNRMIEPYRSITPAEVAEVTREIIRPERINRLTYFPRTD